ncbi:MAG: right-handed parallel beta-helix repeat-containing protein, partial [Planctomycetota bacterium]
MEIVIRPHHQWLVNILPLASVNEETQIAQTALAGTYRLTLFKASKKSCWVENVLEALDEPGEWVLNSQEGK